MLLAGAPTLGSSGSGLTWAAAYATLGPLGLVAVAAHGLLTFLGLVVHVLAGPPAVVLGFLAFGGPPVTRRLLACVQIALCASLVVQGAPTGVQLLFLPSLLAAWLLLAPPRPA